MTMFRRMRRLRVNPLVRDFASPCLIEPSQLILPIFVREAISKPLAIESMPGHFQWPLNRLAEHCRQLQDQGVKNVIVFGVPKKKDALAMAAYHRSGIGAKAIEVIKKACPHLLVIADVCLCEYTSHGHCGILSKNSRQIDNDKTLPLLAKSALTYARAGADILAPSDMMDGRVRMIRSVLDQHRFTDIPIMAYSVKYASSLYGPFRDAAQSTPKFGDRKSYQMSVCSGSSEALREAMTDIAEDADFLMVKPAGWYLDILKELKQKFVVPVGCYQVSGEFSMIKVASQKGLLDEKKAVLESHQAFARAGADFIISYFTRELVQWLKK